MNGVKWAILILLSLFVFVFKQWPDGKMHLIFCDVGEGDAAIIIRGKFQAVIDTGPGIAKFDECFSRYVPFWDRKIEVVYISHQHADHAGALADLKKRYTIEKIMDKTGSTDVMRYGSLYIDTLIGNTPVPSNVLGTSTENDSSVILDMKYGNFSALFTSDIDEKGELALLDKGVLTKVNVLKVAHHGSKFGSTDLFLRKVMPEVAVVSVGAKNTYGHPNKDTLMRIDAVGSKTFRTDTMGTIEIITDGEKYEVRHR